VTSRDSHGITVTYVTLQEQNTSAFTVTKKISEFINTQMIYRNKTVYQPYVYQCCSTLSKMHNVALHVHDL